MIVVKAMIISIIHYAILFNLAAASDGMTSHLMVDNDRNHQRRNLAACSDHNGDKWGCQAAGTGTECTYDNKSKLCTGDLSPPQPTPQPTTAMPTTANPTTAQPTNAPTTAEPTPNPTTPAPTNEVRTIIQNPIFYSMYLLTHMIDGFLI